MMQIRYWLLIAGVFLASTVQAHKPSDSYLNLQTSSRDNVVHVQWDIAVRDLDMALQLDDNRDSVVTWGEVRERQVDLFAYAQSHLSLRSDSGDCLLRPGEMLIDDHSDGAYVVLRFDAACTRGPHSLSVTYSLLFDVDPSHRGLLRLDDGSDSISAVLSPAQASQTFSLEGGSSRWTTFLQFVGDGIHHIWVGYDHILFLVSLLLPSVLVRRKNHWIPVGTLGDALLSVLAVVTAFTAAHSITLTLAALGVIGLPSRLVESGIAFSVVLAALNNVWPKVTRRAWMLAFAFGLVHGFGFASVLADLGLPPGALAISLAGFNIGVELGQLSIVGAVVPLIFLCRNKTCYRPAVLVGGSCAIALVAGAWLCSRALNLGLG
jgi:hypothetical protein